MSFQSSHQFMYMRKIYYLGLFLFGIVSCQSQSSNEAEVEGAENVLQPVGLYGNTQGTTFAIVSNDPIDLDMKTVMDIFHQFDMALSGYIDSSIVSRLNNAPAGTFLYTDPYHYFNRCYRLSQEVFQIGQGTFDPTVFPLVNGWGFLKDMENIPDSIVVDSLLALVGFQEGRHFSFKPLLDKAGQDSSSAAIVKHTPGSKLDFNAIAQGLSVDVIAEELERRGSKNYYVEIGGEIRVRGKNEEGNYWRIGIDSPIDESNAENRQIQEVVELKDVSIATSGSYRKFYEKNGVRYSHTLDPISGYPVSHTLLSASVIAGSCAIADAYATAFMVMGAERAVDFVTAHPELHLDIYLIFINDHDEFETYYTKGFGNRILI